MNKRYGYFIASCLSYKLLWNIFLLLGAVRPDPAIVVPAVEDKNQEDQEEGNIGL